MGFDVSRTMNTFDRSPIQLAISNKVFVRHYPSDQRTPYRSSIVQVI